MRKSKNNISRHQDYCNAPICDNATDETIWYPGEEVCLKTPLTPIQKKQLRINESFKKGGFADHTGFTLKKLVQSSF